MTKKEEMKDDFNLEEEVKLIQEPDWYKEAFLRVMDTSKIKSKSALDKAFKEFGEMK